MPHFVYILELLTGHLYTGTTSDLAKRMKRHAGGCGPRTTLLGGYKRVLFTESFPDRLAALRRERLPAPRSNPPRLTARLPAPPCGAGR